MRREEVAMKRPLTEKQRDILKRQAEFEVQGKLNDHVEEITWEHVDRVTADFDFVPKRFSFRLWSALVRLIVGLILGPVLNKIACGTTVKGRKNLKGIKSAIVTCNHVHDLDNLMVRQAVRGHSLYIAVGEFNNFNNFIGKIMRGGGTLPLSQNITAMRNFSSAVRDLLARNCYVLFYPEGALWWRYEKPRPYMTGAFHYAVQSNVPVIPTFITYKRAGWLRRHIYSTKKVMTINVLPPVYCPKGLDRHDAIEHLRDKTFEAVKAFYEAYYHKPLVYDGVLPDIDA